MWRCTVDRKCLGPKVEESLIKWKQVSAARVWWVKENLDWGGGQSQMTIGLEDCDETSGLILPNQEAIRIRRAVSLSAIVWRRTQRRQVLMEGDQWALFTKYSKKLTDTESNWWYPRAQLVKSLPAMQETPVQFLGQEDLLEKG